MTVTGIAGSQNTNVVKGPTILNKVLPLANTEYSHTFLDGTRRFTLKNRGSGLLKLSYVSGQSGVEWFSIEPGTTYGEEDIRTVSLTLYIQSPSAAQTLEILSWV